ncbi:hypothetical protein COB57_02265 [Candidatus Peregrinibacteria bacterium]|nr:MAG: hypothetical protein COB57_02265 [Candidatus Peregrinibacteria bacterium]
MNKLQKSILLAGSIAAASMNIGCGSGGGGGDGVNAPATTLSSKVTLQDNTTTETTEIGNGLTTPDVTILKDGINQSVLAKVRQLLGHSIQFNLCQVNPVTKAIDACNNAGNVRQPVDQQDIDGARFDYKATMNAQSDGSTYEGRLQAEYRPDLSAQSTGATTFTTTLMNFHFKEKETDAVDLNAINTLLAPGYNPLSFTGGLFQSVQKALQKIMGTSPENNETK